MGRWSVSETGLNYLMEYTNGFKRSIRRSQVTKISQGATVTYASSQSPNLTLAEKNYYIQSYTAGTSTIDFTNNGGDDWTVGFKIAVSDLPSGWSVVNYDYNVTFAEGGNYTLIESGTKTSDYDVTSNLSGNGAGVYALSCQYNMTDGINNLYILIGNLIKVDASGNVLGAIKKDGLKANAVSGLSIDYTAYVTQIGVSEIINVDAIDANIDVLTNLSHSLNDTVTLPIGTGGVVVYTDLDNTFWTDLGSLLSNPFTLGNFYLMYCTS